jgi:hypothetical protein
LARAYSTRDTNVFGHLQNIRDGHAFKTCGRAKTAKREQHANKANQLKPGPQHFQQRSVRQILSDAFLCCTLLIRKQISNWQSAICNLPSAILNLEF